ncbi:MAG TPA: mannosyltransferase family protein [Ktedonobacteraceae bacterium]|nr:mannosyltransferase family protein [Ktedonobacteraceae bacterium]
MQIEEPTITTAGEPTPEDSIIQVWHTVLDPWWKATLGILPTFIITRLIMVLLTYFGGVLFTVQNYSPFALSFNAVLYNWYHWDVDRYLTIATKGYQTLEYAAFFPLYPAIVHAFSVLLHLDVLLAGMTISNLAFLGTLIVLYRLVEMEFDREMAKRCVLYLSIFPTALFFFAAYNESLFLFLMLLCFYSLRQSKWWLAGIFGGLATLTRSIGLFLAIVFVYEFARQNLPRFQQAWQEKQLWQEWRLLVKLLAVVIIPLGLGIYAYALYRRFGDPLAFTHAQANWRQNLSWPWVAPYLSIRSVLHLSPFTFASTHILIELAALGLFLALLVMCFVGPERLAKDQWSYVLFGALALIFALIFPGIPSPGGIPYDPMPSMQRFVLEIFVGFIILARLGRRPWFHQAYLLFSLPMLAFLVLQFLTGHWTI